MPEFGLGPCSDELALSVFQHREWARTVTEPGGGDRRAGSPAECREQEPRVSVAGSPPDRPADAAHQEYLPCGEEHCLEPQTDPARLRPAAPSPRRTPLHADGHEFYVELSFSIVLDVSGDPLGALAHARDITERFDKDRDTRGRLRALEQLLADREPGDSATVPASA